MKSRQDHVFLQSAGQAYGVVSGWLMELAAGR
jgi:hypothetical protein